MRLGPIGESVVAGPVAVAGGRPRDVGDDCSSSRPVRIGTISPVRERSRRRRHVAPVRADSHGNRAPSRPERACAARPPEAAKAVLEHRARCGRLRRGEEREDEDVAVPEDVAAVAGAREPARSDGRLAVRRPTTPSGGRARTGRRAAARRRRRCRRRRFPAGGPGRRCSASNGSSPATPSSEALASSAVGTRSGSAT